MLPIVVPPRWEPLAGYPPQPSQETVIEAEWIDVMETSPPVPQSPRASVKIKEYENLLAQQSERDQLAQAQLEAGREQQRQLRREVLEREEIFHQQTKRFCDAWRQNPALKWRQFDFFGGSIEEREQILACNKA